MASMNPFDLLGDDDTEDPTQLIAAHQQKLPPAAAAPPPPKKASAQAQSQAQPAKPAPKLPSKPLPPSQAVREAKNDSQRGGGRGGGRGRSGGHGFNRDSADNENTFGSSNGYVGGYRASEDGETGKPTERRAFGASRGGFRGGRRGGFNNGDAAEGERPRRVFERRSGTGRGNEFKREGAGRGNWGTPTDEIAPETEEPVNEGEKVVEGEKQPEQDDAGEANKDASANEPEEKEPEEKEMTLEEYEKVLEEKRKALLSQKPEERKVGLDKEFESMQLLSNKKNEDDIFIKLGADNKDKRKEVNEKTKKSLSINEFLKPADGEATYYRPGGRGRGRGRGRGGYGGNNLNNAEAPSIQDVAQFPSLGAK